MISILTLNATSMDLILVYTFCRFNNISIFWYIHQAKADGFIAICTVLVMKYGMGYLACALIRITSTNMFYVNLQPDILLKIYWRFKIEPHCFDGCLYQRRPQILAALFSNVGICEVFKAVPATENMSWFILLPLQSFVSVLNQLSHCCHVMLLGIKSLDWFTLYIHIHRLFPLKYCRVKKSNSRSPKRVLELVTFTSPKKSPKYILIDRLIPSDGKWHRRV